MWRVVFLSVIQSSLLAGGQVFLKFALQKMQPFGWTRAFWDSLLLNWQFACSGLLFGSSSVLWMYIVKHYRHSECLCTVGRRGKDKTADRGCCCGHEDHAV